MFTRFHNSLVHVLRMCASYFNYDRFYVSTVNCVLSSLITCRNVKNCYTDKLLNSYVLESYNVVAKTLHK